MELLEQRIRKDGIVRPGDLLSVDSFLNHQMDVSLFAELGREYKRLFDGCGVNKLLTIEASGIGVASITALQFGCPLVSAKKKQRTADLSAFFTADIHSYTHGNDYKAAVSRRYLGKGDRVLIIDDFLATGSAMEGLIQIVQESGAELAGVGIVIEKAYQGGGDHLRSRGIRVESLARIKCMSVENGFEFC